MGIGMADVAEVYHCGRRFLRIHGHCPLRRIGTDTRLGRADLPM
jgi:hypothetical protein